MNRRSFLWVISLLITLTLVFAFPKIVHSEETATLRQMRGGCMRGNQMSQCDGRIIHQLFANHEQVHRTVEEIPNGIRAVTESDNPEVTALLQEHVPKMYQRIENRQGIPMMRMSETLPVLAQHRDRYHRQYAMTSRGIIVTETSDDPELVAVIREHAKEVSGFVESGMAKMRARRME